jgi:hypothetical protein
MTTEQQLRQQLAETFAAEEGSRNSGKYWAEVLHPNWRGPRPLHWCGASVLWALRKVLGCPWHWEVRGTYGDEQSGFLYHLRPTDTPEPGDICYRDKPYRHHAMVVAYNPETHVVMTIDGNSGNPPGIVSRNIRDLKWWTAVYSVKPLVQAALASSE